MSTPDTAPHRDGETGSATIEFIGLATVLLIPVVYLLIMISQLQAAGYASVAAADQIARVTAVSDTNAQAESRSQAVLNRTLRDYGLDPGIATHQVRCTHTPCSAAGGRITVTVTASVGLPLVPTLFGRDTRVATMTSTSSHRVGAFE